MNAYDFLREARSLKSLSELKYLVMTRIPQNKNEELWRNGKDVIFDSETDANDYADILEDLTGEITFVRPFMNGLTGSWYYAALAHSCRNQ